MKNNWQKRKEKDAPGVAKTVPAGTSGTRVRSGDGEYLEWLAGLKADIRRAQLQSAVRVDEALLRLDIGTWGWTSPGNALPPDRERMA